MSYEWVIDRIDCYYSDFENNRIPKLFYQSNNISDPYNASEQDKAKELLNRKKNEFKNILNEVLKGKEILFNDERKYHFFNEEMESIKSEIDMALMGMMFYTTDEEIQIQSIPGGTQINEINPYETMDTFFKATENSVNNIKEIIFRHSSFPLFNEILKDNQSVIIIGENGAGKSSLLNDLKKAKLKSTCTIPAQKDLYIYHNSDPRTIEELLDSQELKVNEKIIFQNNKIFTNLITRLMKEHQQSKSDCPTITNSKMDRINLLYKEIFPEIQFKTESIEGVIEVVRNTGENSSIYNINNLSDGERSALYYIAFVVSAPEKSIFIIDEPETHLHSSICNKLWDILLGFKNQSKFVFISHDINFITSRTDTVLCWCK